MKTSKIIDKYFIRGIQRHGIVGLMWVAAERIAGLVRELLPSVRAEIKAREQRAAEFDQQFGVDTAGCIHPTELVISSPNQKYAVSYGGCDPKCFRDAVGSLSIDHGKFLFIDFGSGKGRAILLATEFPFKRIIGLEFSEELHRIAQVNIRHFRNNISKCKNVESVHIDAVNYLLPDDCLVCYFNNPFSDSIMAQILSQIRNSLSQKSREIFVVYYNPRAAYLLDQDDCYKDIGKIGAIRMWQAIKQ